MNKKKNNIKIHLLRCYQGNRKSAGITLIALVVTIIILLILAGVTIGLATNGTGLFEKAKLATDEYNNSVEKENIELEKISNDIESYVDGNRDTVTLSTEQYDELIARITALENKSNSLGQVLYTGNFNSGSINVPNFDKYSYLIAVCDWGWVIPLYKNDDGYMYGVGGRGGKTSSDNSICIMGLSLSYSGNTITYIEGKYGFLNSSNTYNNLMIKKIIGIY